MKECVIIAIIKENKKGHNLLSAIKNVREKEDHKIQKKIHQQSNNYDKLFAESDCNLVEGLYKGRCKDRKPSFEYMTTKDCLLVFKCKDCNKT